MKKSLIAAFVALLGLSGTALAQEGDAAAGQQKASTCAGCHGANGNSSNPLWPDLAGQHADYLVQQLQAFKSGARQNPLMTPQAQPLSEQDMRDLAAYYSSQTMQVDAASEELVDLGETIYRAGLPEKNVAACMACHGPTGDGNAPANFPKIGGQNAGYLMSALQEFRSGERKTDANAMMRNIASQLSDDEIKAVSSYVSGLYRGE